jgi:hypothetical protein
MAAIPASATTRTPSSIAVSARIGGVPASQPRMPGPRSNAGPKANWSSCANQPWTGGRSVR